MTDTDYATARQQLHDTALTLRDTQTAYDFEYSLIANDLRGTKASMSETDKARAKTLMLEQHAELVSDLETAREEHDAAQCAFDIADDAGKNWRREMERETADTWYTIEEMRLDAINRHTDLARTNQETARLNIQTVSGITQANTTARAVMTTVPRRTLDTLDTPATYTTEAER